MDYFTTDNEWARQNIGPNWRSREAALAKLCQVLSAGAALPLRAPTPKAPVPPGCRRQMRTVRREVTTVNYERWNEAQRSTREQAENTVTFFGRTEPTYYTEDVPDAVLVTEQCEERFVRGGTARRAVVVVDGEEYERVVVTPEEEGPWTPCGTVTWTAYFYQESITFGDDDA